MMRHLIKIYSGNSNIFSFGAIRAYKMSRTHHLLSFRISLHFYDFSQLFNPKSTNMCHYILLHGKNLRDCCTTVTHCHPHLLDRWSKKLQIFTNET